MTISRMSKRGSDLLNVFVGSRGQLKDTDLVFLLDELNRQVKDKYMANFREEIDELHNPWEVWSTMEIIKKVTYQNKGFTPSLDKINMSVEFELTIDEYKQLLYSTTSSFSGKIIICDKAKSSKSWKTLNGRNETKW